MTVKSIILNTKKLNQQQLNELYIKSAESNVIDNNKQIFHFHEEQSFIEVIQMLQQASIDFEIENKANSKLQQAVREGNKQNMLVALSEGADLNCLDRSDFAKLHPDIEKELMETIADYLQQQKLSQNRTAMLSSTYIKSYLMKIS